MACGLPVIATDCAMLPELVRGAGLLAKPKAFMTMQYGTDFAVVDEHDVAKKMLKLARDRVLREEMAAAARERAVQLTWEPIVERWHQVFQAAKAMA
jgi:glycosyltransferase involved in cell wall biosynthesis